MGTPGGMEVLWWLAAHVTPSLGPWLPQTAGLAPVGEGSWGMSSTHVPAGLHLVSPQMGALGAEAGPEN